MVKVPRRPEVLPIDDELLELMVGIKTKLELDEVRQSLARNRRVQQRATIGFAEIGIILYRRVSHFSYEYKIKNPIHRNSNSWWRLPRIERSDPWSRQGGDALRH